VSGTLAALFKFLGAPLADIVATAAMGEAAGKIATGLANLAGERFENDGDRRTATRLVEEVADDIIEQLATFFQSEGAPSVNVEAVAFEIASALRFGIDASVLLNAELDPARIYAHFKSSHQVNEAHFSTSELEVYDRALQMVSRYCCSIAQQFPSYEAKKAQLLLARLKQLSGQSERILDSLNRIEIAVDKADQAEPRRRYEADYRAAVVRNLDRLDIFGIDFADELRGYPLSIAYVSLTLLSDTNKHVPSVAEFLVSLEKKSKRLLVKGDAGCGKSTLFRWIAIRAAEGRSTPGKNWIDNIFGSHHSAAHVIFAARNALEIDLDRIASAEHWNSLESPETSLRHYFSHKRDLQAHVKSHQQWWDRIPFLITLRDCEEGRLPSPEDFPAFVARELGSPPTDWVKDILREGRAVVLFDGVDEIPHTQRASLKQQLSSIIDAYPENMYLVSGRPAALPDGWLQSKGFVEAAINPMPREGIQKFVESWHVAAAEILSTHNIVDETAKLAPNLISVLEATPSLMRIAATPLICAALCALHRSRQSHLPERPTEIFSSLCHMFLHRRDEEQGIKLQGWPEAYRKLSSDEKRVIVRALAHYMVRNGQSRIERVDATSQVRKTMATLHRHRDAYPEQILTSLIERSGMLRAPSNTQVEFIHNTFKEYLAAEAFVDEGDIGQLAHNCLDSAWQQVVLFAMAASSQAFATRLLGAILQRKQGTTNTAQIRSVNIMAVRARSAALILSPEIQEEIDALIKRLFPPRTISEAMGLAEAGDDAVPFLSRRREFSAKQAAACVRALSQIKTKRAIEAARTYINERRWTVVHELGALIEPLEIPLFRAQFLTSPYTAPGWFLRKHVRQLTPLYTLPEREAITTLYLGSTGLKDVHGIGSLSKLETLHLDNTAVSDLSPLLQLPSLRFLSIHNSHVESVKTLEVLPKLVRLHAMRCPKLKIETIGTLSKLRGLLLTMKSDEHVASLEKLTKLKACDIHVETKGLSTPPPISRGLLSLGIRISDSFPIEGLNQFSELEYLLISRDTEDDLDFLTGIKLPNLKTIVLGHTLVAKLQEKDLSGMPSLKTIGLKAGSRRLESAIKSDIASTGVRNLLDVRRADLAYRSLMDNIYA